MNGIQLSRIKANHNHLMERLNLSPEKREQENIGEEWHNSCTKMREDAEVLILFVKSASDPSEWPGTMDGSHLARATIIGQMRERIDSLQSQLEHLSAIG